MAFGPSASSGCQWHVFSISGIVPLALKKTLIFKSLQVHLRINSKVNFYFYKKRQSKQYKTHVKDIIEWASSGAWLCKGCESRGRGKAVLLLGWPGQLLRRKRPAGHWRPQTGAGYSGVLPIPTRKGSNRAEGGLRWGCCTEKVEKGLRGTFGWSLLTGERGNSIGHSGFSVVCNDQHFF